MMWNTKLVFLFGVSILTLGACGGGSNKQATSEGESTIPVVRTLDLTPGSEVARLPIAFHTKSSLVAINGSQVYGEELFRYDSSQNEFVLLKDLWAGEESSQPSPRHIGKDLFYFSATTPDEGRQLWRTDGSPEGTFVIQTIDQASLSTHEVGYEDIFAFVCQIESQTGICATHGEKNDFEMLYAFDESSNERANSAFNISSSIFFTTTGQREGVAFREALEYDTNDNQLRVVGDFLPGQSFEGKVDDKYIFSERSRIFSRSIQDNEETVIFENSGLRSHTIMIVPGQILFQSHSSYYSYSSITNEVTELQDPELDGADRLRFESIDYSESTSEIILSYVAETDSTAHLRLYRWNGAPEFIADIDLSDYFDEVDTLSVSSSYPALDIFPIRLTLDNPSRSLWYFIDRTAGTATYEPLLTRDARFPLQAIFEDQAYFSVSGLDDQTEVQLARFGDGDSGLQLLTNFGRNGAKSRVEHTPLLRNGQVVLSLESDFEQSNRIVRFDENFRGPKQSIDSIGSFDSPIDDFELSELIEFDTELLAVGYNDLLEKSQIYKIDLDLGQIELFYQDGDGENLSGVIQSETDLYYEVYSSGSTESRLYQYVSSQNTSRELTWARTDSRRRFLDLTGNKILFQQRISPTSSLEKVVMIDLVLETEATLFEETTDQSIATVQKMRKSDSSSFHLIVSVDQDSASLNIGIWNSDLTEKTKEVTLDDVSFAKLLDHSKSLSHLVLGIGRASDSTQSTYAFSIDNQNLRELEGGCQGMCDFQRRNSKFGLNDRPVIEFRFKDGDRFGVLREDFSGIDLIQSSKDSRVTSSFEIQNQIYIVEFLNGISELKKLNPQSFELETAASSQRVFVGGFIAVVNDTSAYFQSRLRSAGGSELLIFRPEAES